MRVTNQSNGFLPVRGFQHVVPPLLKVARQLISGLHQLGGRAARARVERTSTVLWRVQTERGGPAEGSWVSSRFWPGRTRMNELGFNELMARAIVYAAGSAGGGSGSRSKLSATRRVSSAMRSAACCRALTYTFSTSLALNTSRTRASDEAGTAR